MAAQSKVCAATACSNGIASTGSTCTLCHLRFCYAHALPEVHGCGDAARGAARKAWLDSKGGTAGPRTLRPSDRAALTSELHKRIDTAVASRTAAAERGGGSSGGSGGGGSGGSGGGGSGGGGKGKKK